MWIKLKKNLSKTKTAARATIIAHNLYQKGFPFIFLSMTGSPLLIYLKVFILFDKEIQVFLAFYASFKSLLISSNFRLLIFRNEHITLKTKWSMVQKR